MLKIKLKKCLSEQQNVSNSDVIKHNTNVILTKTWDDYSNGIYSSIFPNDGLDLTDFMSSVRPEDLDPEDRKYIENAKKQKRERIAQLINQISCLRAFKIVKPITGASFGKIFKMSNGHILKLFSDSLNVGEDMNWYRDNHNKMFSGEANMNTLPVFDFGSLDIEGAVGGKIYYVEMAEIMPLDKWIANTNRKSNDYEDNSREGLSVILSWYEEVRRQQRKADKPHLTKEEAIEETFKMIERAKSSYQPYTQAEAESIIGAFWEAEQSGWPLQDVAPRNMGIVNVAPKKGVQDDPANPIIIIFDR